MVLIRLSAALSFYKTLVLILTVNVCETNMFVWSDFLLTERSALMISVMSLMLCWMLIGEEWY